MASQSPLRPASSAPERVAVQDDRDRTSAHSSFLAYRNFRWLKVAVLFALAAMVGYWFVDDSPRHGGGTWYGYILGTIGLLLILWLTGLGLRKRVMSRGAFSLKGWTSAHVYLGLSLIIIATLHTGFQFGWNVHTLAYVLMMLVILSGIWGISVYATLPAALSNNRDERTQAQMIDDIRSLDRQLHEAAQPLPPQDAELVRQSLLQDPFAGSAFQRLTGRYPRYTTADAREIFRREVDRQRGDPHSETLTKIENLLARKQSALARLRRHLKLKALLEIWLYVHVPLTFALIAALSAHVISVFFYW